MVSTGYVLFQLESKNLMRNKELSRFEAFYMYYQGMPKPK